MNKCYDLSSKSLVDSNSQYMSYTIYMMWCGYTSQGCLHTQKGSRLIQFTRTTLVNQIGLYLAYNEGFGSWLTKKWIIKAQTYFLEGYNLINDYFSSLLNFLLFHFFFTSLFIFLFLFLHFTSLHFFTFFFTFDSLLLTFYFFFPSLFSLHG